MLKAKKILIEEFHLVELGYDMMGYYLQEGDIFTLHHLLIPARKGGKANTNNGAILCGKTAHPYFHIVEKREKLIFAAITAEILEMKRKGRLDLVNLRKIHFLLCEFEAKHSDDENDIGEPIIKPEYRIRLFKN